ncbi:RNA polymerase sigma factor [Porticoccaceae bacterium LTM1]|nr:RNA polymerase sigma factor [Porticoccaceae bacterium LTM1]
MTLKSQEKATADQFDRLVRPHIPALYRMAYKLAGSQFDAEDIVQDVLIKLYPKTAEMAEVEQLEPWLKRVVYNQFVDLSRRQKRNPASYQNSDTPEDPDSLEQQPASTPGPEKSVQNSQQSQVIEQALSTLSHDNRVLVVMHLIEGFTLQEVSELIDVPLGTLKSRLHRVKAELKKSLRVEPFAGAKRVIGRGGHHEMF